ncbi:hypothetical protein DFP72DRAFT_206832 [Ephemerocybe angulata]|uniref:Uncharacterized protein n=1 Tax=Ephemerocybe angulata TaxID=980116 RepID=A0A8H6MGJ9_9AGAR|nr:hypothetical protein DFP72DRAFT_206832 [Tulosesus angulatus]
MHLIYENLIKNLLDFFSGSFKDLSHEEKGYRIPKKAWDAIAEATTASGKTIPGAYGARPRGFADDRMGITADMLSFWTIYLGPVYLEKEFLNDEFYYHFVDLVKLINLCLLFHLSEAQLEEIRTGFIDWVKEYERLYYEYSEGRLSACPLTVHSLLHIAEYIALLGPVWVYWAFPMERFCGRLGRMIKSRRFPYANLDNQVFAQAQLKCIVNTYNVGDQITMGLQPKTWDTKIGDDASYQEYRVLAPRRPCDFSKIPLVKRAVAAALVTRYSDVTTGKNAFEMETALKILTSSEVETWGRLKRLNEGDTMLASKLTSGKTEDRRNASFVRYELYRDRNARTTKKDADYDYLTYYGELEYIFVVKIPGNLSFLPEGVQIPPTTLGLAAIRQCKITRQHPFGLDINYYKTMMPRLEVVDIAAVQCLVGRTLWRRGEWAIIDRSGDLARATPDFED